MKVSLREYARYRGVTPPAVRDAIKRGRLSSKSCQRVGRQWEIDVDLADEEWQSQTDLLQQRTAEQHRKPRQTGLWGQETARRKNGSSGQHDSLVKVQTVRLGYQAELVRLQVEREEGSLVKKTEVDAAAYAKARLTRDRILQIPDRIADELAAISDAGTIHQRLSEELADALLELVGEDGDDS
jgi:hypothetical protein